MTDDPWDLLRAAKDLLVIDDEQTAGLWPRAAALLARQALELGLERLWQAAAPGLDRAPMRCQLLSLGTFLQDRAMAERCSYAWTMLSRASHHRPYELPPTLAELSGWLSDVSDVLTAADKRSHAIMSRGQE